MTQDDVIQITRSLGICELTTKPKQKIHYSLTIHEMLEAFKLVIEREREACAKVCEYESGDGPDNGCCPTYWNEAQEACAKAIRARGQQ